MANPRTRARAMKSLERETGFEPATSTLARSHSTTELLPLDCLILDKALCAVKPMRFLTCGFPHTYRNTGTNARRLPTAGQVPGSPLGRRESAECDCQN